MKTLLTIVASLLAMTAQAQTTFEHFTVYDQWLAFGECPNCSSIIVPGEFYCTGGGEADPDAPFACEGGNGIHIRDTQMVSCILEPETNDWRLEGTGWWDVAANWDSLYAGPVSGTWRIVPGECPDLDLVLNPATYWDDIYTYWEGTYTGKREMTLDPDAPFGVKWIATLKFVGQGMGDLAGQKLTAEETITTFYSVPLPGEAFGITDPEGILEVTIKTKY